jgi:hypothetical protein
VDPCRLFFSILEEEKTNVMVTTIPSVVGAGGRATTHLLCEVVVVQPSPITIDGDNCTTTPLISTIYRRVVT